MRFAFVEEHHTEIPVNRLCEIMDVSPRGYRAWRSRPLSDSQRKDMVVLAHIRAQFALSQGSYGRPRMAEELKELGIDVGHGRVGRLMRQDGISVKRSKRFKATTDRNHSFNIAPNLLDRDVSADRPNQKWAGHSRDIRFANALPCNGHQLCLDTGRLAPSRTRHCPRTNGGQRLVS